MLVDVSELELSCMELAAGHLREVHKSASAEYVQNVVDRARRSSVITLPGPDGEPNQTFPASFFPRLTEDWDA